ncbi:MAG: hypothetical protein WD426_02460 [Anditalea sp.]
MDLRLANGRKNDQSDSGDFTQDIQKDDLSIRNLGYCTLTYLKKYTVKEHFLSTGFLPRQMFMRTKHRKLCSVWKYYKYASLISQKIRKALKNRHQMEKILIRSREIAPRQFKLEKKKGKLSQMRHL